MLIGYACVSKADGSQSLDLQRDALRDEGVDAVNLYHDFASGARDDRPGLDNGLRALRKGDAGLPEESNRLLRPASCFPIAAFVCLLAAAPAASQVPPDEAWRAIETERFRVIFPEHLEALGRRAGDLAERAYRELTAQFREGPSGRIDIVLSDHVDVSNGSATIWPSNRILLYARPPADDLALAYFDDWLELLVVHELAHVFHLDYGGTMGRIFRALFGRAQTPLNFPGAVVPRWVIEGLATWYESALTGAGRVHGTFHEMVLRTAMLEGRFESIGQAGGNSPQWPGGIRRYAYGALFFDYLLDKHGRDGMAAFVEAVVRPAAQLPLPRLNSASRRAFGATLSSEWAAWTNERRARARRLDEALAELGPISEPEALTRNARYGLHPTLSPDGSALLYLRSDGRSDPRLVVISPASGEQSTVTRTNNRTPLDVLPTGEIVFAQRDYTDRYRVFSDLYVATIEGSVRRVTESARLTAPSAGPDGTWVVAVTEGGGTNGLARIDLRDGATETLVAPATGTYWADPAVSPDGRWVAASRWRERRHDVVILDADGRVMHEVTRDRALDLAPDWSADGRHLVWSSDRTGILNVLGAEIDPHTAAAGPPVMLTNVRTGAAFPSVDPASEWLYFSGYHVDGWEVERVPFAPDAAPPAPVPAARFEEVATPARDTRDTAASDPGGMTPRVAGVTAAPPPGGAESAVHEYSPSSTLYPRYWLPALREPTATAPATVGDVEVPRTEVLGYAVGGRTSGIDLVGRHSYDIGAKVFTSGGRGEGDVSYEYRGLGNPTIGVTASQRWDDGGVRVRPAGAAGSPETFFVLERERRLATSVRIHRPGVRTSTSLRFSAGLAPERSGSAGRCTTADRRLPPRAARQPAERVRGLVQRVHRAVACVPDGQRAWRRTVSARADSRRPERSGGPRQARRRRSLRRRSPRPAAPLRSVAGAGLRCAGPGGPRERRDGPRTGRADRLLRVRRRVGRPRDIGGASLTGGRLGLLSRSGLRDLHAVGTLCMVHHRGVAGAAGPRQPRPRSVAAAPRPHLRIRLLRRRQRLGWRRVIFRRRKSQAPPPGVGGIRGEHRPPRPVLGATPAACRCRVPAGRPGRAAVLRPPGPTVLICRCSGVDTRRAPSFGGHPDVSAAVPATVCERSALRGVVLQLRPVAAGSLKRSSR